MDMDGMCCLYYLRLEGPATRDEVTSCLFLFAIEESCCEFKQVAGLFFKVPTPSF